MYFRASSCPDVPGRGGQPVVGRGSRCSMGRQLRRWALAARVTVVSATPQASLPRVLPVQGADDQQVQQALGADGLRLLHGWRLPGGRRCAPSPASGRGRCQTGCRCRRTTSETMGMTWSTGPSPPPGPPWPCGGCRRSRTPRIPQFYVPYCSLPFQISHVPARGACCRWCSEWRRQR